MSDPVTVAIMRVKNGIPPDILKQAFMPKRYDPTRQERYFDNVNGLSIDQRIRELVIEARVAIDVNLNSGTEMFLPLCFAEVDFIDAYNVVYRFPREALGGRNITTVHELIYGLTQGLSSSTNSGFDRRAGDMLMVGRDIMRAVSGSTVMGTAYVQLVGINTILVNDINQLVGDGAVRVRVSHEANFNNLDPMYYSEFAELVFRAVKAYIYNNLIIDLDEGQIRAGASLGRIREIVDSYADADQMYMDYLNVDWKKVGMLADQELKRKILKLSLGARPKY